ncbi:MAG: hypothetical protein IJH54_04700, partial [Clostridia bacterium]|nr:hypothetical protein [Clostridia bacterium]
HVSAFLSVDLRCCLLIVTVLFRPKILFSAHESKWTDPKANRQIYDGPSVFYNIGIKHRSKVWTVGGQITPGA